MSGEISSVNAANPLPVVGSGQESASNTPNVDAANNVCKEKCSDKCKIRFKLLNSKNEPLPGATYYIAGTKTQPEGTPDQKTDGAGLTSWFETECNEEVKLYFIRNVGGKIEPQESTPQNKQDIIKETYEVAKELCSCKLVEKEVIVLKDITEAEGQKIHDEAAKWAGTRIGGPHCSDRQHRFLS